MLDLNDDAPNVGYALTVSPAAIHARAPGRHVLLQTLVAEILAAWRRAERLAGTLEPGSAERAAVDRACERLRGAYHELTESGVAHGLTAREARDLLKNVDPAADLTG
jgi:hypothetical protein